MTDASSQARTPAAARPTPSGARRWTRLAGRSSLYCALLLPVSLAALAAAIAGRRGSAVAWWRGLRVRLLDGSAVPARQPRTTAVVAHALVSLALGLVALVPLGVQVLFVLRGLLYGLVDRGPYDHSWGGPSRGGAWVAHIAAGIPEVLAALAVLVGIAALHQRLTASLDGVRRPRWLLPTVAMTVLATALLFVAWTRQL
ncbi:hypothetical protein AB0J82_34960 [Asanoa sp. NPDC049518]|uniref:hypothetical protein n=1 Tax=unclassified Asanoa TaxID=2685164 RepID=UPI003435D512